MEHLHKLSAKIYLLFHICKKKCFICIKMVYLFALMH